MAAIVNDLKACQRWQHRTYAADEVTALTAWLASSQCAKEMAMTENLWDNMKRLSARVGMHCHPVFEYADQYVKMASKDVSRR